VSRRVRLLSVVAWLLVIGSVLAGRAGRDGLAGGLAAVGGLALIAAGGSMPRDQLPWGIRPLTVGTGVFFVAAGIAIAV
jgi:hypothetical protein